MRALAARFFSFKVPVPTVSYALNMAANLAMQHPITYRCLDKISTSVQSAAWYCEKDPYASSDRQRAVTAAGINEVDQILRMPYTGFTGLQARYWMALTLACYGRFSILVSASSDGKVNGFFPLAESLVKGTPDSMGVIRTVEYGDATGKRTYKTIHSVARNDAGRPREPFVYQYIKPNLIPLGEMTNPNTPLAAIGLPAEIFNLLLQRARDTASGQPNTRTIVTADGSLTQPQAREIKDKFDDRLPGEAESGDIMLLTGTNIKVTELNNDLSDIHSKIPLDDSARQIAGNFGIPVALLGFSGVDGSKFANNYVESRRAFFEDTIDPSYFSPIEEALSIAICPPGYRIRFDRDSLNATREARAAIAKAWSDVPFVSIDEKREITNFAPVGNTTIPSPVGRQANTLNTNAQATENPTEMQENGAIQ